MKKALGVGSVVGVASFASVAYADFVGGGFVTLQSWNDAANATIGAHLGQSVTVFRMYALFDGVSPTSDQVGGVGDIWLRSKHAIVNLTESLHDSGNPFESPLVEWDSFVTINIEDLQDGLAASTYGDGFDDDPNMLTGGWWVSIATDQGQAGTNAGASIVAPLGLHAVMLAQITVLREPGLQGDRHSFNVDGTMGSMGDEFVGTLSLVMRNPSQPTINGIWFGPLAPAPGSAAALLLVGAFSAQRRRRWDF